METNLTLTKLKKSVDHEYVTNIAECLVLAVDKGTYIERVVFDKPFQEKIDNVSEDYNEDCTLKEDANIHIVAAHYTTKEFLSEVLGDIVRGLQN